MDEKLLIEKALNTRALAYTPYSGYAVGAALLGENGVIYTGCNIENASYPATVCAERVALFKAVSEGVRAFSVLAVAGGPAEEEAPLSGFAVPCGICRQVLFEFSPALVVLVARSGESYHRYTLGDLLPEGFGAHSLHGAG